MKPSTTKAMPSWVSMRLSGEGAKLTLDHLWVQPRSLRLGVGRRLFQDAVARATELGARRIEIESDPNAEAFYIKMGAQTIGEVTYELEGLPRSLPLLAFTIGEAPTADFSLGPADDACIYAHGGKITTLPATPRGTRRSRRRKFARSGRHNGCPHTASPLMSAVAPAQMYATWPNVACSRWGSILRSTRYTLAGSASWNAYRKSPIARGSCRRTSRPCRYTTPVPATFLDLGCSHGLPPSLRPAFAQGIVANLRPGGYYHLYAFDYVPPADSGANDERMGMFENEVIERFTPALEVVEIVRAAA